MVSGKKSIPSRGSPETAVASSTVSPYRTRTAPSACSASLPASSEKVWAPISASTLIATCSSECLCVPLRAPALIPETVPLFGLGAGGGLCGRSGRLVGRRRWAPWVPARTLCRIRVTGRSGTRHACVWLAAQSKPRDHGAVTVNVVADEVGQQPTALTDELEQSSARVVVVLVRAQVLRQGRDTLGQERDLYLGGAGIAIVCGVVVHDRAFRVLGERHLFLQQSFLVVGIVPDRHLLRPGRPRSGASGRRSEPVSEGAASVDDVALHLLDERSG